MTQVVLFSPNSMIPMFVSVFALVVSRVIIELNIRFFHIHIIKGIVTRDILTCDLPGDVFITPKLFCFITLGVCGE